MHRAHLPPPPFQTEIEGEDEWMYELEQMKPSDASLHNAAWKKLSAADPATIPGDSEAAVRLRAAIAMVKGKKKYVRTLRSSVMVLHHDMEAESVC